MRRIHHFLIAVSLVTLVAMRGRAESPACEKCGRAMGPPSLMLLAQKSLQAELKLSEDQVKKVSDAWAQQRAELRKLRELPAEEREKKFAETCGASWQVVKGIVTPEQGHRLRQIVWQQEGPLAFCNPRVAEALNLSAEQKAKIEAIHQEARQAARKLFTQESQPAPQEIRSTMTEVHKSCDAKIMALITDEQKAKWQEMIGAPFTADFRLDRHAN